MDEWTKGMTEWQQTTATVQSRDDFLLQSNMWADCIVKVGTEQKEFECHRLQLAKSSSVLGDLLYYSDAGHDSTVFLLPDVDPAAFSAFLRYAYLDDNTDKTLVSKCQEQLLKINRLKVSGTPKPKMRRIQIPTWQYFKKSVLERDTELFRTGDFSDCSFSFGNNTQFKCHRLVLAKTSPVFAAMLYSPLARDKIECHDDDPELFKHLLRYAYKGRMEHISWDLIWDLLSIGNKYLFPDIFLDRLRGQIWVQLYPNKIWSTLATAELYEEQDIIQACWQVIEVATSHCLNLPDFVDIPKEVLLQVTKLKQMSCNEIELFQASERWWLHSLSPEEKSALENLQHSLGSILQHVQLPSIPAQDFKSHLIKNAIFTRATQECQKLKVTAAVKHSTFSYYEPKNSRPKAKISSLKVWGCPLSELDLLNSAGSSIPLNTFDIFTSMDFKMPQLGHEYFTGRNTVAVHPSEIGRIVGVEVFSQRKPSRCNKEEYQEKLTVLVCDQNSKVIYTHTFTGIVKYGGVTKVPFLRAIERSFGAIVKIKLIFHTSGHYPYPKSDTELSSGLITYFSRKQQQLFVNLENVVVCEHGYPKLIRSIVFCDPTSEYPHNASRTSRRFLRMEDALNDMVNFCDCGCYDEYDDFN